MSWLHRWGGKGVATVYAVESPIKGHSHTIELPPNKGQA